MDYKDLGARVRIARRNKSWTQEALAERVGISASFLGHIERGTRVASLETFVALCNELQVLPEYLLCKNLEFVETLAPTSMSEEERTTLQSFLQLAQEMVANGKK